MINLRNEQLLTLQEAADLLPGQPAISTLHRWRQRGMRGIKLETCLIGGKRYTSTQALQRFTNAVTSAVDGEPCFDATASDEEVSRQLDQLGF